MDEETEGQRGNKGPKCVSLGCWSRGTNPKAGLQRAGAEHPSSASFLSVGAHTPLAGCSLGIPHSPACYPTSWQAWMKGGPSHGGLSQSPSSLLPAGCVQEPRAHTDRPAGEAQGMLGLASRQREGVAPTGSLNPKASFFSAPRPRC